MSNEKHYRKLEHMYYSAPINRYFNPELTISEGTADVKVKMDKKYFHAANAAHGAVYFKMLDDAAFFAVNSVVEDVFVLTTTFNVHFLRPVDRGTLRAVGRLTFASKTVFVAEARLYNDQDKEIAIGTGTFLRSKTSLTEDIGYKE
jgi:uncharacterized protein (TIGR00369 family)